MAQPIVLKSIIPREAVADGLYRALYGLDANNRELWESAWLKEDDISFDMGQPMVGLKAINEGVFDRVGALVTQHLTSNVRIDLADNAKTAKLFAYAQNQHFRAGEGTDPTTKGLLGGALYEVDLKEDPADGLWKIKTWKMQLIWLDGDRSVIGG